MSVEQKPYNANIGQQASRTIDTNTILHNWHGGHVSGGVRT